MGRHELDAAMAVPVDVPVDKRGHPLTGCLLTGERPAGVVRPILTAPRDCVYAVRNSDSE